MTPSLESSTQAASSPAGSDSGARSAGLRGAARKSRRPGWLRGLQQFVSDRRGVVAVVAAVVFPVVLGGAGLGAETSYWYMTQRKLQHAADIAAHAASVRNRAGDAIEEIRAVATHISIQAGFLASQGTIEVNVPPLSGPSKGDSDAAEVILTENWPRWFTDLFADGPVTLHARAVSKIRGGANACILALSPIAAGAVTVSGSTSVSLHECDVASNSVAADAYLLDGSSATMSTGCVHTVGGASYTSLNPDEGAPYQPGLTLTRCPAVNINAPEVRDPYRDVAEPAVTGNCDNNANVGHPTSSTTLTTNYDHPSGVRSRRFCKGLDLKGNVTLEPGLYIIEGGNLTINGGDASSSSAAGIIAHGVTFYMVGTARIVLNGSVDISVAAPTSGPFSGIAFFGDRSATGVKHVIDGNSGSIVQGAVYTPASHVSFEGNSTVAEGCTQVIASTITMTGNSTLRSDCENAGTLPMMADEGAAIIE